MRRKGSLSGYWRTNWAELICLLGSNAGPACLTKPQMNMTHDRRPTVPLMHSEHVNTHTHTRENPTSRRCTPIHTQRKGHSLPTPSPAGSFYANDSSSHVRAAVMHNSTQREAAGSHRGARFTWTCILHVRERSVCICMSEHLYPLSSKWPKVQRPSAAKPNKLLFTCNKYFFIP